jgi:hypothetical protein
MEGDNSPYQPLQEAILDIFTVLSKDDANDDILTTKANFVNSEIFRFNKFYDYTYYEPLEMLVATKFESFFSKLEATFHDNVDILDNFQSAWTRCHNLEKWLTISLKRANFEPPCQILIADSFHRFIYSNKRVREHVDSYLARSTDQTDRLVEIIKICTLIGVKPPEDNLEVIRLFRVYESESIQMDEKSILFDSNVLFFSNNTIKDDDTTNVRNVKFYCNEIKSEPEGDYIENIHAKWWGRWDILERHHGYIQWLFPIRHGGLNSHSQPMTKHEAEIFRNSPDMISRVKKSYEMMMEFLGIDVIDENGKLRPNPKNWEERAYFLSRSSHNYLRLTRIMKCFTILGLESYKLNLIAFFVEQVFKNKVLEETMESLMTYWFGTISKESDLQKMEDLVMEYSGCRCDRTLYKYAVVSWAEKFELDIEARNWLLIEKPTVKFPDHERRPSNFYFEKKHVPVKYPEYKPVQEKLPEEDMDMGSLF